MTLTFITEPEGAIILPDGYRKFLEEIKGKIRESQIRAGLAVNRELIFLYWSIGKAIRDKQFIEKWGSKIIDRMAKDLSIEFPGVSGFSRRSYSVQIKWKIH